MTTFDLTDQTLDDEGEVLYEYESLDISPGVTVLVGCNGSGKTTLMKIMKSQLKNDKTAVVIDADTHHAQSRALSGNDVITMATYVSSSEGEKMSIAQGPIFQSIGAFVRDHTDDVKSLWILMDSFDSGSDIPSIRIMKEMLHLVESDLPDIDFYAIVSANMYEFTRNETSIDVTTGNHLTFDSYEQYSDFVEQSYKRKQKRYGEL